jgi:hypothetical protein
MKAAHHEMSIEIEAQTRNRSIRPLPRALTSSCSTTCPSTSSRCGSPYRWTREGRTVWRRHAGSHSRTRPHWSGLRLDRSVDTLGPGRRPELRAGAREVGRRANRAGCPPRRHEPRRTQTNCGTRMNPENPNEPCRTL